MQARNPAHYEKVSSTLAAVREYVAPDMAPWIEATFDATDVECIAWRVSDPPKVRVSFTLDKTRYTAIVATRSVKPKRLR